MNHFVRIMGGEWRGRRIKVSSSKSLRPTPGRIRETLFNWIGADISGMRVLDLFAGTGVLGFEALSRGAESAVFIEKNRKIAERLRESCHQFDLSAERARVFCAESMSWLRRDQSNWNLVYVDPPFHRHELYERVLPILRDRSNATDLVYVEFNRRMPLEFCGFQTWKSSEVGEVRFALLQPLSS